MTSRLFAVVNVRAPITAGPASMSRDGVRFPWSQGRCGVFDGILRVLSQRPFSWPSSLSDPFDLIAVHLVL